VLYLWNPPATCNGNFAFTAKVKLGSFQNFSTVVTFIIAAPVQRKPLPGSMPEYIVFPNPALRTLHVKLKSNAFSMQQIELLDGLGRVVLNWEGVNKTEWTLSLPTLPKGLYTLRYKDDAGVKTTKIILAQ